MSSSSKGLPTSSTSSSPSPRRNIPRLLVCGSFHSSSVISCPSKRYQMRSSLLVFLICRPLKNFERRRLGCALRRAMAFLVNSKEGLLLRAPAPVVPAGGVVLAVGVVVPALGATELVAAGEHRRALRQQQGREEVALLPRAELVHALVGGRSLEAAVPRLAVVVAVLVAFAVRVVVLVVVADQIAQGEAVVRGDEVDRRGRPAAVVPA